MSRLNGNRAQAQAEHLKVNVAILGAGRIAHAMATTLVKMAADPRYANLVAPYAVAARDGERAAAFAAQYGFPVSYGSYEELLADPQVDLVYIATPHSLHAEQGIMCLQAGKNILVEKSFTANAAQARELLAVAEASGLLCTEAIWTRYMPSRRMIDDIVASGVIGEVKMVDANLCYPVSGKARMTDPMLAGGALLDVGVYPLNFIDMVLGPRSMLVSSDRGGYVWGTDGYIVCQNINNVEGIDVYNNDHALMAHHDVPTQLTGYEYQVADAANAILDGLTECAAMPHADTVRIMELMDQVRDQWGLAYPFE